MPALPSQTRWLKGRPTAPPRPPARPATAAKRADSRRGILPRRRCPELAIVVAAHLAPAIRMFCCAAWLHRPVAPGFAHGARYIRVGIRVADELLFGRIPGKLAPRAQRDRAQVADRDAAVADFWFADRGLSGADAIEEIAHVVGADVEPYGAGRKFFLDDLGTAGNDFLAIDEEPAVSPLKTHAVALVLIAQFPRRRTGESLGVDRPAGEPHAVGMYIQP